MKLFFADTAYWIALLHKGDSHHSIALALSRDLDEASIVTTDEVLAEVLNYFSKRGPTSRRIAHRSVRRILEKGEVRVVSQTHESFLGGLRLYGERADKAYSHTDCVSMAVMRRLGIGEALTNDHHFEQEGFQVLLT